MRLTTDRVHVEEGAVAAATWFESLPLLRIRCSGVLAETISYSSRRARSTRRFEIRRLKLALLPRSLAATLVVLPSISLIPSARSRQFSPIQIYESEKKSANAAGV
jgi:hypothetical protein